MSNDEDRPEGPEDRPESISDEVTRKYDPERLLKMLARRMGRGEALDHHLRHKYEKRFGVDLGHVRIYSGEFAEEFNKQRNAYAVTLGRTGAILMGGSPDKTGAAGQALLAHELTHVAQAQRATAGAGGLHRKASFGELAFGGEEADIEAEAEEEEAAEAGLQGTNSSAKSVNEGHGEEKAREQFLQDLERIKHRVIELAGDAARTQMWRNGNPRRA